ncbi:hypothetical protein LSH36_436g03001 [Paralvinella palmiformis]|uniref:Carbohydrate sulfotransferase n=1 Tax=Paralvinella palmiformis TaxID=53620 RepID=A0AAD9JCJ4_9ANNE|nr:hypothetical protein LSH36_436g03001 [Paralvinella palmiformis]
MSQREDRQQSIEDILAGCSNRVRKDHINEICHTHSWSPPEVTYRMLFVIEDYKLLYCDLPKCGSTTFKTILGDLVMPVGYDYDMNHFTDVTGYRMFDDLSKEEQEVVMKDYFKMIVLRHPLDRLRSTYMDKLMLVDPDGNRTRENYKKGIKQYLIEKGQVTEESFELHKDIMNFEQFLDLVSLQRANFKNIHWDTYWNLCSPCEFKYDLIIKLETLNDDVQGLYDYLRSVNSSARLPEVIPRTHIRIRDKNANRLSVVSDMLKDMNQDIITNITELYRKDMIWAGYDWNREDGAICKLGSRSCC